MPYFRVTAQGPVLKIFDDIWQDITFDVEADNVHQALLIANKINAERQDDAVEITSVVKVDTSFDDKYEEVEVDKPVEDNYDE